MLTPYKSQQVFKALAKERPKPTTELHFQTPFQLLIAVMLSAQTTDISVNKATAVLFKKAPDVHQMYALGEANIRETIKNLGLYNTKATNAWRICQILIEQHQGKVPRSRAALESLPGVGRKTANVVLNTAFGEPVIAVDTHVFRVAKRLGLAQGSTVENVEQELMTSVPRRYIQDAHHWLILHGRYRCKAQRPLCDECPAQRWCEHFNQKGKS